MTSQEKLDSVSAMMEKLTAVREGMLALALEGHLTSEDFKPLNELERRLGDLRMELRPEYEPLTFAKLSEAWGKD